MSDCCLTPSEQFQLYQVENKLLFDIFETVMISV